MIDRTHPLSVSRQAQLLNISRGAVYYLPKPTSQSDLVLMNAIDKLAIAGALLGAGNCVGMTTLTGAFAANAADAPDPDAPAAYSRVRRICL